MAKESGLKVLFLITARGGSKSVPDKNLREINGISLIGFKAISALKSNHCTRLIISTESPRIQEEARKYKVEVPFTRPSSLATDTATSTDVIAHAMLWIETETDDKYDAVMLLEPSSPLTRSADYDNAVKIMMDNDANLVVGMRETEVHSVFIGSLDENARIAQIIDQMHGLTAVRRQDMPKEYTMNGGLYLFKWDFFKEHRTIYQDREKSFGYVMDRYHSIEIDQMIDLRWTEFLIDKGYVDMTSWE